MNTKTLCVVFSLFHQHKLLTWACPGFKGMYVNHNTVVDADIFTLSIRLCDINLQVQMTPFIFTGSLW